MPLNISRLMKLPWSKVDGSLGDSWSENVMA
jgi:hypothetical protein